MSQSRADGYVPPPTLLRMLAGAYLSIFGRKAFYRWNERLLIVAARGICVSDPMMRTIGIGEKSFLRRIARIPISTAFDVGANIGLYSARLKELCPSAKIWAFEPHAGTFKELAAVAASAGFTAVNVGLSDRPGKADLYDYAHTVDASGSPHASLHRQVIERLHGSEAAATEVVVTTVDDLMSSEGIQHLSLLKVDAEGHELAILKGAARTIGAGKVDIVQFEVNEMNVISRVFLRDFYEALPGFSLYRMVVDGLAPLGEYRPRTHELFFLHNVVAIRNGFDRRSTVL